LTRLSMLRAARDRVASMNLDWIAGFFDGEGSVSLQFHKVPACKYGYQFLPTIHITQKNAEILGEIQTYLGCGRIYGARCPALQIVGQPNIRKFISMFKPISKLKRRQLELLEEAVNLLHSRALRGSELWGGALPKKNVLRLLDIVEEIRALNGNRGKRTNDVSVVRKIVQDFDEGAYQERIRVGWLKRIAPLVERKRLVKDGRLPPETIRMLYWNEGLNPEEIGARLQCSRTLIVRQMKRHGIPRRGVGRRRLSNAQGIQTSHSYGL